MYWSGSESRVVAATPYSKDYKGSGNYAVSSSNFRERNTDALITATKDTLKANEEYLKSLEN